MKSKSAELLSSSSSSILGKRTRKKSSSYEQIPLSDDDCSSPSDDKDGSNSPHRKVRRSHAACSVFLLKAHSIITKCPPDIGGWTADGNSFILKDIDRFAAEVIPLAYKHNHWTSFMRQLNSYGFSKIKSDGISMINEFSHPYFIKGRIDLLQQIKRASANQTTPLGNDEIELSQLKQQVDSLETSMKSITNLVNDLASSVRQLLAHAAISSSSVLASTARRTTSNTSTLSSTARRTISSNSRGFLEAFDGIFEGMTEEDFNNLVNNHKAD